MNITRSLFDAYLKCPTKCWHLWDAESSALSAVSFYRAVDGATVDVPGEVGVAANQWVALCAQHGSRQM